MIALVVRRIIGVLLACHFSISDRANDKAGEGRRLHRYRGRVPNLSNDLAECRKLLAQPKRKEPGLSSSADHLQPVSSKEYHLYHAEAAARRHARPTGQSPLRL